MARPLQRSPIKSVSLRVSLTLVTIAVGTLLTRFPGARQSPPQNLALESVVVRRDELRTTLLAGGDLRPVRDSTVKCLVEDLTDADGMMILSMIRNGASVKKGDELCRLDSSALEELAQHEEILLNEARASCLSVQLALETAKNALREYEEGLVAESTKEFEGRLALGHSEMQRQADRVDWIVSMVAKGYLSQGQLLNDRQALARAQHELRKSEGEFKLFRGFRVPKEIRALRAQVEAAQNTYGVEAVRLKSKEDRLAHIRKQIENCTIRAPHDGIVVHANKNRWWMPPLQPGEYIYEDEELFMLPDLTEMEVHVSVHESMGARVRAGMKADVRIAALSGRTFSGRVAAIDQVPIPNWKEWDERLKHFIARVRFDKTPAGLLPFMSAEVTIDTGRVPDALVIPVESMSIEDGQHSCYVLAEVGLERRAITTRGATQDLVEVTAGLYEGERVLLRSLDAVGIPQVEGTRDPQSGPIGQRTASSSRSKPAVYAAARGS
jgi:HlyD family secretion protein